MTTNPLADALDNPAAAPSLAQPGDVAPELGRFDEAPPFPAGCPVQVLGNQQDVLGNQLIYYLNRNGQIVGLQAGNKHGKLALAALFGETIGWLESHFPQWSPPQYEGRGKDRHLVKESQIIGFDQAEAAQALVIEGTRKGIFDPAGRMRGRGAHRIGTRGMALHCGDKLLISRVKADGSIRDWHWIDPGLHDRQVYPAAEPVPRPWHEPCDTRAAEKLLRALQSWQWKRPLLDARFVLGGIGGSFVGGWQRWRSNLWIHGGKGTGKSTLNGKNGLIHQLFGEGVFRTGNTSAAGIRQSLKNSTVPVMLDEIEASADNRRVNEVIELARIASSGDNMTRGSADHTAQEFTLQSVFWFSSILIPPIEPQDKSRLALCELKPIPIGTPPLDLDAMGLPKMGRELQRRMIDGLWRLEATKAKFHGALAASGHDSRACDQFGTLLACADLLINDWDDCADGLPDDEEVAHWAGLCRPERMTEISDAMSDEAACLNRITTSQVQARGGDEREAIGSWISKAVCGAMLPLLEREAEPGEERAGKKLEQLGLKLVNASYKPEERDLKGEVTRPGRWGACEFMAGEPGFLAIAGRHEAIADLFKGSKWQGGVWLQSLARFEGCIDRVKVKFARMPLNAVLVPLWAVLEEEDLPAASRRKAAEAWLAEQMKGAGA